MSTELATAYISLVPTTKGITGQLEAQIVGPAGLAGDKAGKGIGAGIASGSRSGILSAKNALTGLGVIGAIAAVKSVQGFSSAAKEVMQLKRQVGGTTEEMSRLRFVAQQSGVSTQTMARAFVLLSKSSAAGKLDQFGIAAKNADGSIKPLPQLLNLLADRYKASGDAGEKNRLLMAAFGKGGAEMGKILSRGSKGIADLEKEADKLGVTLTDKNLDAIAKNLTATRRFSAATEGLKIQLGQALIPALTGAASAGTKVEEAFAHQPAVLRNAELGATALAVAYSKLNGPLGRLSARGGAALDTLQGAGPRGLAQAGVGVAQVGADTTSARAAAATEALSTARLRLSQATADAAKMEKVFGAGATETKGSAAALAAAEQEVALAEAEAGAAAKAEATAMADLTAAHETAGKTATAFGGYLGPLSLGLAAAVGGVSVMNADIKLLEDRMTHFKGSPTELAAELRLFGTTGVTGGAAADAYGKKLAGIGPKLKELENSFDAASAHENGFVRFLAGDSRQNEGAARFRNAAKAVKELDTALSSDRSQGGTAGAQATAAYDRIVKQFGLTTKQAAADFPLYTQAVKDMAAADEAGAAAAQRHAGAIAAAAERRRFLDAASARATQSLDAQVTARPTTDGVLAQIQTNQQLGASWTTAKDAERAYADDLETAAGRGKVIDDLRKQAVQTAISDAASVKSAEDGVTQAYEQRATAIKTLQSAQAALVADGKQDVQLVKDMATAIDQAKASIVSLRRSAARDKVGVKEAKIAMDAAIEAAKTGPLDPSDPTAQTHLDDEAALARLDYADAVDRATESQKASNQATADGVAKSPQVLAVQEQIHQNALQTQKDREAEATAILGVAKANDAIGTAAAAAAAAVQKSRDDQVTAYGNIRDAEVEAKGKADDLKTAASDAALAWATSANAAGLPVGAIMTGLSTLASSSLPQVKSAIDAIILELSTAVPTIAPPTPHVNDPANQNQHTAGNRPTPESTSAPTGTGGGDGGSHHQRDARGAKGGFGDDAQLHPSPDGHSGLNDGLWVSSEKANNAFRGVAESTGALRRFFELNAHATEAQKAFYLKQAQLQSFHGKPAEGKGDVHVHGNIVVELPAKSTRQQADDFANLVLQGAPR